MDMMQTRRAFLATSLSALVPVATSQAAPRVERKVLAEVRADSNLYRVVSATNGEAAWCELRKTDITNGVTKILSQDQILFTNGDNDGGPAVPLAIKRALASGYAQSLIDQLGGVKAYSQSMAQSAQYGVPLPTGLLREALAHKGVWFPSPR